MRGGARIHDLLADRFGRAPLRRWGVASASIGVTPGYGLWRGRGQLPIVCELPAAARNPDGSFALAALDAQERDDLVNAVRMYVNLCSEEHYLHSRGNIDHYTWRIWTLGMEDAFRAAWFRATWLELRHEYRAYEEFRTFFDEFEAAADKATE